MNKIKRISSAIESMQLAESLTDNKQSFIHKMGRYSTYFVLPDKNIKFLVNEKNNKCFIAYKMIENDCSFNFLPDLNENKVKFFNTQLEDMYADKIFSTDINSAYANILMNEGLISEKTFSYLCELPKKDRLAAVGMLASKWKKYHHEDGQISFVERYENPLSRVFWFAVAKTYNIMMELKGILKEDFLYSWVDCVYYSNKKRCSNIVNECLNDFKLKYKSQWIFDFEVKERDMDFRIAYRKNENIFSPEIIQYFPRHYNTYQNRKITLY